MKKWLFLIILIFLSACGSPEIPKWYVNTPKDNSLYFYAAAEGYSKQNAIKNALNDIASRINIKISSNFVINKGIHNQKTYSEIYQQINTQISNVGFNNYEILKTEKQDDKYYVLLRVNKQKLIQNLKTKIKIKLNTIDFNNGSAIKNVIYAYQTLFKLKKLKSDVFILESLGLNINSYLNTIQNLEKKALSIIKSTGFKIVSDKFKTPAIQAFSKYLIISDNAKNIIKIKIKIQKHLLFESYIITAKATITLDKPYTLSFLSKSVSSYKEAENFAKEEYRLRLLKLLKNIFKISVF